MKSLSNKFQGGGIVKSFRPMPELVLPCHVLTEEQEKKLFSHMDTNEDGSITIHIGTPIET